MKPGAIYNSNRFFLRALLQAPRLRGHRLRNRAGPAATQPSRLCASRRRRTTSSSPAAACRWARKTTSSPPCNRWAPSISGRSPIKPGKPFAYGKVGASHFIGLPGNPVSSFVTFLLLVRPFLLRLQGASQTVPKPVSLPAHFNWPRADKRREFLRARRNAEGGLDLFPNQSSGVLTSVAWGDGLIDNPPGQTIARGDAVSFISFAELLS